MSGTLISKLVHGVVPLILGSGQDISSPILQQGTACSRTSSLPGPEYGTIIGETVLNEDPATGLFVITVRKALPRIALNFWMHHQTSNPNGQAAELELHLLRVRENRKIKSGPSGGNTQMDGEYVGRWDLTAGTLGITAGSEEAKFMEGSVISASGAQRWIDTIAANATYPPSALNWTTTGGNGQDGKVSLILDLAGNTVVVGRLKSSSGYVMGGNWYLF